MIHLCIIGNGIFDAVNIYGGITLKKILQNQTVKLFLGALILFMGILLYLPQAGVVRSFPFIIILSFAAHFFISDLRVLLGFSFIMSFLLHCTIGNSVTRALFLSVACVAFAFIGAMLLDGLKRQKKSASKHAEVSSRLVGFVLPLVIGVVLYTLLCGNIFSAAKNSSYNNRYIEENYPETVSRSYTYYCVPAFAYRTCVEFMYNSESVGKTKECIIQQKGGEFTDGIRDWLEDYMLQSYERVMSYVIGSGADNFSILASDIDFDRGEIIDMDAEVGKYAERVNYAVAVYALEMDKSYFEKICLEICNAINDTDNFSCGSVTFVGVDAEKVRFSAHVDFSENSSAELDVSEFKKSDLDAFGVSEDDVLLYWSGN